MKIGGNEVEAVSVIDPGGIDRANYFMTLVSAAAEAGILPPAEVETIQSQIYDILSDVIWMYNSGSSTSVISELAEEFVKSIVFALDCFCLAETGGGLNNEKLAELLRVRGVRRCYEKGIEYIERILRSARKLYREAAASKLDVPVTLYNDTINNALAKSLRGYQKYFFAHQTGADIDYPIALQDESLNRKGILYIREYLGRIYFENCFCALFDADELQNLLRAFAAASRLRVSEIMENIFGIVYANAFFAALAGKSGSLLIESERYDEIERAFRGKDEAELTAMMKRLALELIAGLNIEKPVLRSYVLKYNEEFMRSVVLGMKSGRLKSMMVLSETSHDK